MMQLAAALLFFLPFERIPSLEFHGVTLRISSLLLVISFLIATPYIIKKKWLFPLSSIDKAVIFYWLIAILSFVAADHHKRSLATLGFLSITIIGYLTISRLARHLLTPGKTLAILSISALTTSVFGIYQFIGDSFFGLSNSLTGLAPQYSKIVFDFPRIQSVGLEPLYFANSLLVPLFLIISYILFQGKKPTLKQVALLLIVMTVFFLTLSRGAYAGALGAAFLSLPVLIFRKETIKNAAIILGVTIISFALSLASIYFVAGTQGTQTFGSQATVTNEESQAASVTPRLVNYKEAWRLFLEKPILGVGIGNYGVVNKVSPPDDKGGYMIVNNQYLETLAETGILGLIALALILIAAYRQLWKAWKASTTPPWILLGLYAGFSAILIQYNFLSTIYLLSFWAVLGLIAAYSSVAAESDHE